MPRFVIRPQAYADLEQITRYIAATSISSSLRFFDAAEETFYLLASSPELGARYNASVPKLSGVRVWQVKGFPSYVVFYRPVDVGIEVVRVFHGARNWDDLNH